MVDTLRIRSEVDIVGVRRSVREAATALGFGATDVTRIVTAASELARNIYTYAGEGTMSWREMRQDGEPYLELCFTDEGPGIVDTDQAMVEGFSTGRGLGLGLPGARRLMGQLEIESSPGVGTRVVTRKALPRRAV